MDLTFYGFFKRCVIGPIVHRLCGAEIEGWENLPKHGGFKLVSNHLTWYDPVVLAVYLPVQISFATKSELFKYPILRPFLIRIGMISLKRENASRQELIEYVERAKSKVDQGLVFGLFPEGTRSRDGKLHEFKPGVGSLLRKISGPIVPVGITYSRRGVKLTTRIVIGSPISNGGCEPDQLVQELRRRIAECSGQEFAELSMGR